MISLGIDTGGTYTDAVALDLETGRVLAKGKSPTTKENLALGIINALGTLPPEMIGEAVMIALSTTLATNACVEDKGGRAKLLLMGTTNEFLRRIDARGEFGLDPDNVLGIDTHGSYDGSFVDIPDWESVYAGNREWFSDAEALAAAELYVFNSGAACEKSARETFGEKLHLPVVLASEIVTDVNILERGATALLNARLMPVIREFIEAVHGALDERSRAPRMMVVRSDASLMSIAMSEEKPVETIISGPAASTIGGMQLSGSLDCVIVDMGGTTTDISIVRDGVPKLADAGIRIGGWSTQIKGVFVETFALGGDSALRIENGKLTLASRRVLPVCAAASRWPGVVDEYTRLLARKTTYGRDFHELLCLIREPEHPERYTEAEMRLVSLLRDGPRMIDHLTPAEGVDKYRLQSARLEAEGILLRCGLTPTDMMHILGDFDLYDKRASELATKFFIANLDHMRGAGPEELAREVYDMVCEKLYTGILRVLLEDRYPGKFAKGIDPQLELLISSGWREGAGSGIIGIGFETPCALVATGAPTHLFLPRVAKALGTRCVVPEHAEVANAVGAAMADIRVSVSVEVEPIYSGGALMGHAVYTPEGRTVFKSLDQAKEFALEAARAQVEEEARRRGASGELRIDASIGARKVRSKTGEEVSFGIHAWALVTGAAVNS